MLARHSSGIWLLAAVVAMTGASCTYIIGVEKDYRIGAADGGGGDAGAGGQGGAGSGGMGGGSGCNPGQADCGSGCVDLASSPDHCGACGRGCGGDACTNGLCTVTSLATTTPGGASAVAVDATYVYWGDRDSGQVTRCSHDGLDPIPLVTGQLGINDLELSGGKVYWTSNTDVGAVDTGGGGEVTLATAEIAPFGITLYMGFVYWTSFSSGAIRGAPIDGMTPPSDQNTTQQNAPTVIVNDGINLYWTNQPSDGEIMMLPIGGGQEVQLADEDAPRELAISDGSLYWVRQAERSIVRMSATMAQLPTIVVSGLGLPRGLAVDGEHVYFTINDGQTCEVMRVRADGAATPLKLADGCTESPFGLAVDATHVYWSDVDGAVKKVAR